MTELLELKNAPKPESRFSLIFMAVPRTGILLVIEYFARLDIVNVQ